MLHVKRLSEHATIPTRATEFSAGLDLHSAHPYVVPAWGNVVVLTDLAITVPDGCYGRIAPRSGLACKFGIDVGAGVIDADYTGNVGVLLFNFTDRHFEIQPGFRVAQLIVEKMQYCTVNEVEELPKTVRGELGFGSTGGF